MVVHKLSKYEFCFIGFIKNIKIKNSVRNYIILPVRNTSVLPIKGS